MESNDHRPLAALGHALMTASAVSAAAKRLEAVGLRAIEVRGDFAVLELRGGTHIIIMTDDSGAICEAPFDLMYDDIDAAHRLFAASGFVVEAVSRARFHDSFSASAPEGFRVKVNSSHASGQPV